MTLLPQTITIPSQLQKNNDFPLKISQNNQKIYTHIEYLKNLVQSMYEIYRKMSKSIIKLCQQHQKKLLKHNDSTALSIINFIKGIQKLFVNIKQQICNNTVNMNKKNQKVSKTRKDIIHQKLSKIYQLFIVYISKVHKYNTSYKQYEQKCMYFSDIQKDVIKFYSTKQNKLIFEQLSKKQSSIQQQLQQTYSLKIQLKSGLCQIRLSLKQFFQMLSNNAEDDKKLLLSVRRRLKETKIFNETIIEEVNSQAEESVGGEYNSMNLKSNNNSNNSSNNNNGNNNNINNHNNNSNNNKLSTQHHSNNNNNINTNNNPLYQQSTPNPNNFHSTTTTTSFFTLKATTIQSDTKQLSINLNQQQFCIETFCQFIETFEKQVIQTAQSIDKLRNTEQFQKFIDKKYQINQILTNDIVYNIESIKNQIADVRQIIQSVKALLDKIKVVNQLKKYRAIKLVKFLNQSEGLVEQQKKCINSNNQNNNNNINNNHNNKLHELRLKYKQQKQKFAKGHLQLMRRFRQMIQDMFKQINQKFKFQRNPQSQSKKIKNQFIQKKYFSLLTLNFFVIKEEPPKFQMNSSLKNYQKYLSEQSLKKIGLSNTQGGEIEASNKTGWGCCGFLGSHNKKPAQKNKYIDEYNCAIRQGKVLIQGKMKIHLNYLKFVSSFNAKTLFGETNLRVPKWDINRIQKTYVLLSIVITVNTVHGELSFTSFLSDPIKKLVQIYSSQQPMLVSTLKKSVKQQQHKQQQQDGKSNNNKMKPTTQSFIIEQKQNTYNNNNNKNNKQYQQQSLKNNHNNDQNNNLISHNSNNSNNYNLSSKHKSNIKSSQNNKPYYQSLSIIQQKLQQQIPQLINKQLVNFQSLSTYLSQNKKQLSISVQYHLKTTSNNNNSLSIKNYHSTQTKHNNQSSTTKHNNNNNQLKQCQVQQQQRRYFFQIKIQQKNNNNIQYKFIHQKNMKDQRVKQMLQNMVTNIINTNNNNDQLNALGITNNNKQSSKQNQYNNSFIKQTNTNNNTHNPNPKQCPISRLFQNSTSSFSFIQRKQNNQFQFDNDPSFVYIKQPSIANGGQHPSFNYQPDLQIFRNMSSDRKLQYRRDQGEGRVNNNNSSSRGKEKEKPLARSRSKSRSSNNNNYNNNKQNNNTHSTVTISKSDIDQYLNSIDQSTIKKNLFITKTNNNKNTIYNNNHQNTNNKTIKKQALIIKGQNNNNKNIMTSNQQTNKTNNYFNVNYLVGLLIVILIMNVMVSIFK